MSLNRELLLRAGATENEVQVLELGRELKARTGEGTLTVEYRNGLEAMLYPGPKIKPLVVGKPRC